jgi:O-antigen/teichoic acid export membrane protein
MNESNVGAFIAKAASGSFVIKILGAGISFGMHVLLARWMGVEQYGIYIYALTWVGLLGLFARHGRNTALVKLIAQYRAQKEWGLARGAIKSSSLSVLFVSLALGGISYLLVPIFFDLRDQQLYTFWLALLLLPVVSLTQLRRSTIQAFKRVVQAQLPDVVVRPLLLIGVAGAAFLITGDKLSAPLVMAVNVAAAFCAFILGGYLLYRLIPHDMKVAVSKFKHREWTMLALPMLFIAGMNMILRQTDIVMIGPFMGSESVGVYGAVSRVTELVSFGLMSVNSIVAPMISEYYHTDRKAELQHMITLASWGIFAATLVLALGLIFFGEWVLALFGEGFDQGYVPLLILLIGQLINALAGSVGFLMIMTGHQTQQAKILAVSAIVNITLNAILIPKFGLLGAASATACATVLWNVSMLYYVVRHIGLNPTILARVKK